MGERRKHRKNNNTTLQCGRANGTNKPYKESKENKNQLYREYTEEISKKRKNKEK